jgi:hypothetical protein
MVRHSDIRGRVFARSSMSGVLYATVPQRFLPEVPDFLVFHLLTALPAHAASPKLLRNLKLSSVRRVHTDSLKTEVDMATNVTRACWESSLRCTGVVFEAESPDGKAEFIIRAATLADLIGEHHLIANQCMKAFEAHVEEISEAAGRVLAAGVPERSRLTVISADKLSSPK